MERMAQLISIFNPSYRRAHRAAASTRYWLRWSYSAEEWQRFDHLDWSRTQRWFYGMLVLLTIVAPCWWALILPVGLPPFLDALESGPWFFRVWMGFVLIVGLISLVMFIRGEWRAFVSGKARHNQRQSPESNRILDIGPLDICQSGICIPLVGANLKLKGVYIDPSDSSLLKFDIVRGRGIPAGMSIPIPNGQEASAQQLVERFAREIL
jgi:hypothetical protein